MYLMLIFQHSMRSLFYFCIMIILENNNLRAVIVNKGAELQSLYNKQTNIEHLWGGDAKYWGKYSPVLFPIVGGLKNDTYIYNNKQYQLPRHGFARDKVFEAKQMNDSEVTFTLVHDEETLKVYPFQFEFKITYTIAEATLFCTYNVKNTGTSEMLFSVGAHPAFAVPLVPNTLYNDCYLKFNETETLYRWKLQDGLIASTSELLNTVNSKLELKPELFYEDAIVLKGLKSNSIILGCNTHSNGLQFEYNDFPFFGIWAAKDAPFVCLEPWCGIADSVNHNQLLNEKEGINNLASNTNWQRTWSVTSF